MNRTCLVSTLTTAITLAACSPKPRDLQPAPQPAETTSAATTEAAITADDLRARLTTFAHDSMMGRESGTLGNYKATEYLAAEAEG